MHNSHPSIARSVYRPTSLPFLKSSSSPLLLLTGAHPLPSSPSCGELTPSPPPSPFRSSPLPSALRSSLAHLLFIPSPPLPSQELRPFRHVEEPLGSYQLRGLDFSPSAQSLVVAGSSAQPGVVDREGRVVGRLMKGDMYIRDMRHTKGHVAAATAAAWHPSDENTLATCAEDATVRLVRP